MTCSRPSFHRLSTIFLGASILVASACGSDLQQAGNADTEGADGGASTGPTTGPVSVTSPASADDDGATGMGSGGTAAVTDTTDAMPPSDSTSGPDPSTGPDPSSSGTASMDGSSSSSTDEGPSGCLSDRACADPTPVCDRTTGECVGCLPDEDTCEAGTYCDATMLACVPGCDDALDCGPQVCDVGTHTCVDCLGDGDCSEGVCDEPAQTCVECVDTGDCPTGVCNGGTCVTLGYDCMGNSNNCNAGEQCCGAVQCSGDCMIPCTMVSQCPPTMGCEHGYCLFPCANNNADCADWPGYTCQHGGTLCETD